MTKKLKIFVFLLFITTLCTFTMQVGMIGGTINKPTEYLYGCSASFGFIVPLLKFEIEYYTMTDRAFEAVTGGVKLGKKVGRFAPYAILGAGTEFQNFTLKTSKYDTFLFVGGGIHFFLIDFLSLRADIRFQNFSGFNKTRLSAGVFFHL